MLKLQDKDSKTSESDPPKAVKSGFEKCRRQIELGLFSMSIVYGLVLSINPPVSPGVDSCPEDKFPCQRSDLLAYKITSAFSLMYMGFLGFKNWYFSQQVRAMFKATPEDRLFGYLKAADDQNVAILCYQLWDFCVSLMIPEHREVIFLVHHFLAGITAWFSLENQMVPYYSVFYGGCSELSSIFLVWADADQFFPPTGGSFYDLFVLFSKGMFALSFFFYRVYGWILYSIPLWKDTLQVLKTGSAEKLRPGKSSFLYLFLVLNVLLGALQLFWFGQIIEKVIKMAEGK